MADTHYPLDRTAYSLVGPYIDVLTEGGNAYPFLEPVAKQVGLLGNPRALNRSRRARASVHRAAPAAPPTASTACQACTSSIRRRSADRCTAAS